MLAKQNNDASYGIVILLLVFINAIVLRQGLTSGANWYRVMAVTLPLLLLSLTIFRTKKF